MRFNYNKLFKLLIDRIINKKQLRERSGVSSTSIAKLAKRSNVITYVLLRICVAFNCEGSDIMEIV